MSLVVKLEDDLGEQTDWVMLHGVLPSREERNFPCLRGIDVHGKTLFNHLQMESFLEEWDRVRDRARDDSQVEAWQKVKDMGEKCRADRDLYLRFVGNLPSNFHTIANDPRNITSNHTALPFRDTLVRAPSAAARRFPRFINAE